MYAKIGNRLLNLDQVTLVEPAETTGPKPALAVHLVGGQIVFFDGDEARQVHGVIDNLPADQFAR